MTTEPKASLGGDGAKRSAPVAWLLTHPTEPTDCELAASWKEPITDADRAAGWSAEPLYRRAAPVLPVEVREKVVAELDHLIKHIVAIGPEKPKLKGTDREYEIPMARRVWREVAADAILSTITGDA